MDASHNDELDDRGAFDGHSDASVDAAVLQELLLGSDTLQAFLDELAIVAARSTDHHCGITVRSVSGAEHYTVASTGDMALALDERQYADGDGPCLEALATAEPVIVTDMQHEQRWGSYPQQALQIGARSSVSYPLVVRGNTIGALNLYSTHTVVPGTGLTTRVANLAGQIAGALALALRLAERDDLIATLRTALTSRSGIDQAMGVLMAQQRCDSRTAFDLLRRASQARNIKLRDVAAQIVASVQRDVPGTARR